jgi:hypothetical protein
MVGVDLDDTRAQCLGQFPLPGRAHQLIAGRDEHGRGQTQFTRPRLSVIPAQGASGVGEPAAELRGQPGPVDVDFGRLLDGLAEDPFHEAGTGAEPQAQLQHWQQSPDHPLPGRPVPFERRRSRGRNTSPRPGRLITRPGGRRGGSGACGRVMDRCSGRANRPTRRASRLTVEFAARAAIAEAAAPVAVMVSARAFPIIFATPLHRPGCHLRPRWSSGRVLSIDSKEAVNHS